MWKERRRERERGKIGEHPHTFGALNSCARQFGQFHCEHSFSRSPPPSVALSPSLSGLCCVYIVHFAIYERASRHLRLGYVCVFGCCACMHYVVRARFWCISGDRNIFSSQFALLFFCAVPCSVCVFFFLFFFAQSKNNAVKSSQNGALCVWLTFYKMKITKSDS